MTDTQTIRRRPRAVRASLEALETRRLLDAGSNAFLSVPGVLATRNQRDRVAVDVSPSEFTLPGGRVVLGLAVHAAPRSRLDPGVLALATSSGGPARVLLRRPNTPRDRASLTLAEVGPGELLAEVRADRRTAGAYRLDAWLAGDADADFDVDMQDLDAIAALQGTRIGRRGYLVDADVDRNGRIDRFDLALARRNLGASWGPAAPLTAGLDGDSDPNGDLHVLRPDVAVEGHATPGATVVLDVGADGSTDRVATADARGAYRIPVDLAYGENALRVAAVDAHGREDEVLLTVTRSDVVLDWNETLLDAIRAEATPPPMAARAMAIVHIAAYDAANAIDRSHASYAFDAREAPWASAEAAVAAASHRALTALYPDLAATFDAALVASLADIADGPGEWRGIELGRRSADAILGLRRRDGSDADWPYEPGTAPGQWRPTPPAFADPLLSQWPFVEPFALIAPDQYRPPGPPALTGAAYAADFEEVRRLGRVDSTERTAEQTGIARFWADGTGTATPPGHWNQIAADVARQRGTGLAENARLFALLNIALADAGIASWDAKYSFGVWRPITAIREADIDGNPATSPDRGWAPLLATPPFPAYTSGHSTFSGAASEVLSFVFGPDTAFTTTSDDVPGMTRSFESFAQAAEEAGMSRIYGGIHFGFDNRDGLLQGRAVARFVTSRMLA